MTRRGQTWLERDFDTVFDDFRRSFDVMMRPYFPLEFQVPEPELTTRYAPLDVIDEGDHYRVRVELPGFTKENVEVRINNDGMHVRAQQEMADEVKKKNYLHRERTFSAFERSVSFPEEIDPDKAEGEMNDGILELKIPKKEPKPETQPRTIELK
jgi:HSP20 family protein